MVVGVVNAGGVLPDHWIGKIIEALDAGLDVATGLHERLGTIPAIAEAAQRGGRRLHDVRYSDMEFATGKGNKRPGLRVLTVGTDCSVGKKYTALALEREMIAQDMKADFRATGQTGVFISGRGVAIDAVIADFIAGAAEWLTPANDADHWDVVEGQGSLFHPSFAGVTLGLLHGSQPDAFIVCHEPTRTDHARRQARPSDDRRGHRADDPRRQAHQSCHPMHRHCRSTPSTFGDTTALALLQKTGAEYRLPCVDPIRTSVGPLVRS